MKLSRFLICGLTALAAAICLHACSEDDPVNPDPDPTPVVDPDNGEVTFVITNESGSGTGTVDAPAEVADGDTLSMVIRQKSSYTDSDGTVFTCEPEAKFSIHAVMDTVYAQNEDLLTKIEDSEVTTSKEGTNPVRNLTKQTIKVGPQSIKAEMLNEVYTYINKAQQAIEMPYARWNELSAESPSADEREEDAQQTKADVNIAKTAVTLTPLAQTRAIVSDTTLYNVNLRLYGEVEVKNAKNETKQPIVIDVNYIGAVVSSMEIPDEDNGEVSFEIESDGIQGEGSAASPYIITPEDALNLVIRQKSRYTDIDGSTFEREPLATINASLGKDVVYAESLDQLTSLAGEAEVNTFEEGNNPVRHAITQAYDLGGMPIDFALGYEVYPYTTQAGETIEMPYGKLNPASYEGTRTQEASAKYAARISKPVVSAVPQTRATVSDTTMYGRLYLRLLIRQVSLQRRKLKTLIWFVWNIAPATPGKRRTIICLCCIMLPFIATDITATARSSPIPLWIRGIWCRSLQVEILKKLVVILPKMKSVLYIVNKLKIVMISTSLFNVVYKFLI